MIQLLLFQCQCVSASEESFLGSEWMSSAVGIAITYIVFVMGIPALLFQTFIPESLRNIYNERFDKRWRTFFIGQLAATIVLFFLSDPMIYSRFSNFMHRHVPPIGDKNLPYFGPITSKDTADACVAFIVFISVIGILLSGFKHLMHNFKSTRNIAQQLSEKIVKSAIKQFDLTGAVSKKDLEDLSILAKELKAGQTKNQYLEECEKLIEHILDTGAEPSRSTCVKKLLEDAVCLSITYEGAQANEENRLKALEILMLVHGHKPRPSRVKAPANLFERWRNQFQKPAPKPPIAYEALAVSDKADAYLHELIGYYVKEVGVAAMLKQDTDSVNEAVEKLYTIDVDPKELFALGAKAIQNANADVMVAALQKMKSKAFHTDPVVSDNKEVASKYHKKKQRTLYFWLGLLSKIHLKDGSARQFAEGQWRTVQPSLQHHGQALPELFDRAYRHFYNLTDFTTADAVSAFQGYLKIESPPTTTAP